MKSKVLIVTLLNGTYCSAQSAGPGFCSGDAPEVVACRWLHANKDYKGLSDLIDTMLLRYSDLRSVQLLFLFTVLQKQ